LETLFFIVCVIQIAFYSSFLRIFFRKNYCIESDEGVSVIIAARNEVKNLEKLVPKLLVQDYFKYEIIIVNDRSEDNTLDYLKSVQCSFMRIFTVGNTTKHTAPKKNALYLGIANAKYDLLVFTDADCIPCSDKWLSSFAQKFDKDIEIVLGYSPYFSQGTLLNGLIRFETFLTAIQYFSAAAWGIPYMGVGRNLAYRKKLFTDNGGFEKHLHIKSGDDDLFVNEFATNKNTTWNIGASATVFSIPKRTWKDWFLQKKRHISTGHHYKFYHIFLIGTFILSLLFFYVSLYSIFSNTNAIFIALFRWLLVIMVWLKYKKLLQESLTLGFMCCLEPVFLVTYFFIGLQNLFSKEIRWKN